MPADWSQQDHLVRCEWGPVGAARLGYADGALVVVDVLSFTTSVDIAVGRGTQVYPAGWRDGTAQALAAREHAVLAAGRREASADHPWTLSPTALRAAPAVRRLVLASPNGSAIAAAAPGVVVAACLRNAAAVAAWVQEQGYGSRRPLLVVPAGERWPDGSLRPAVEDLLGAGALLSALGDQSRRWSVEAVLARSAFLAASDPADLVRRSASGCELVESGFATDVELAIEIGTSTTVPLLQEGRFTDAQQSPP